MHQHLSSPHKPTRPPRKTESLAVGSFVVSFDAQRFYRCRRYYWTVCEAENLEELVLWGHAPTLRLAEFAARTAIEKLELGSPAGQADSHSTTRGDAGHQRLSRQVHILKAGATA